MVMGLALNSAVEGKRQTSNYANRQVQFRIINKPNVHVSGLREETLSYMKNNVNFTQGDNRQESNYFISLRQQVKQVDHHVSKDKLKMLCKNMKYSLTY